MKILHILSTCDPTNGGVAECVFQLSNELVKQSHEVELLSFDSDDSEWVKSSKFKINCINPTYTKYKYSFNFQKWLKKYHMNYDKIIIHGIWQYHSFATWRTLRKFDIEYYIYVHGMLDPWFKKKYPFKHLKKWFFWPWSDYRVLRDAKAVFFTTQQELEDSKKSFWLYDCEKNVIPIGITKNISNSDTAIQIFYNNYPHLRAKKILLFMSRIHEKKGIDLLLKAFSNIHNLDSTYHLVIAGPDQEGLKGKLIDLAESLSINKNITWLGMISGEIKWGALYSSNVFVLPSHQENFGIVVAEALSCGLPVIISNKVNIYYEVENYNAGIICDDTTKDCQNALQKWFLLTEHEKDEMRRNSIQCFNENFEITKAVKDLIDIIS